MDRDFSHCDVCGVDITPDRMHIMIDNGLTIRNTYACRKHRYVKVVSILGGDRTNEHSHDWLQIDPDLKALDAYVCTCGAYKYITVQERTDRDIENLAFKFRGGDLSYEWE